MGKTVKIVHTCGGPVFGKLAAAGECPRCDELRGGAPARRLAWAERRARRLDAEARFRRELAAHDCKRAGCGPVCTFGDW